MIDVDCLSHFVPWALGFDFGKRHHLLGVDGDLSGSGCFGMET